MKCCILLVMHKLFYTQRNIARIQFSMDFHTESAMIKEPIEMGNILLSETTI